MNVKLDWEFDEDGLEEPEGHALAYSSPPSVLPMPDYCGLERNSELLRIWIITRFADQKDPAWLFLWASLILFGTLFFMYLAV